MTSRRRRHYVELVRNSYTLQPMSYRGCWSWALIQSTRLVAYLHCAATTKIINAFHIKNSIPLHIFPPTFCCIHFNIMIYYHYQLAKLYLRDAMGVWNVSECECNCARSNSFSILTFSHKRDTIYRVLDLFLFSSVQRGLIPISVP